MHFENENVKVDLEEGKDCLVTLRAHLTPLATQKAYKEAIKRINKEVSLPGFRKGKAPDQVIEKNYGSYVEKEWKDLCIHSAFEHATKLAQIYPYSQRSIQKPTLESCSLESGSSVLIKYERYPVLPTIDFSKLEVKKLEADPINESEVDEILHALQKNHGTFEAINGRVAEVGDHVRVTLEKVEGEERTPLITERRIEMDDKKIAPWLLNLLLGTEVGQSKEGDVEVTDENERAMLPKRVNVTVHSIEKLILPPLDDELAKKAGAPSLEELKNHIRQNILREKQEELRKRKFLEVERALLATYPFEVPSSLTREIEERTLRGKLDALKKLNLPADDHEKRKEEIESRVKQEVNDALRLRFLIETIAKQCKIEVSTQEINQRISEELAYNPTYFGDQKDKAMLSKKIDRLSDALFEEKVLSHALAEVEARSA